MADTHHEQLLRTVVHVYEIDDGLITRMDVEEASP
jgi:hypothetical protein